jgi:hypothetical protein
LTNDLYQSVTYMQHRGGTGAMGGVPVRYIYTMTEMGFLGSLLTTMVYIWCYFAYLGGECHFRG